ncbi:MAG: hypothetical protein JWM11_4704 [Planctomycetaceae bacterium]|nr:hypothetical protein [Planctomycetaceae bacterium]
MECSLRGFDRELRPGQRVRGQKSFVGWPPSAVASSEPELNENVHTAKQNFTVLDYGLYLHLAKTQTAEAGHPTA